MYNRTPTAFTRRHMHVVESYSQTDRLHQAGRPVLKDKQSKSWRGWDDASVMKKSHVSKHWGPSRK